MQYLSVGTNQILADLHQPIRNGQIKPTGGLWATIHDPNYPNYNPWIEVLSIHPHILFYKNLHSNPFLLPASLITLNTNAKIFIIKTKNQLKFLKKYYPTNDDWIDFEKLSQDFDGIFLDLDRILQNISPEDRRKIKTFAVSTLIIFNLNCIKHYQKATVDIVPFDFEFENEFTDYQIIIDEEIKHISDSSQEFSSLIADIKKQEFTNWPISETYINQKYNLLLSCFAENYKEKYHYSEPTETLKQLLARHISRSI